MTKKYELVKGDTKEWLGRTLYRIRALIEIGLSVASGDLGGYVESEKNLSQDGDAWVSGNAQVSGDARVYGDAWVSGNARVYGNAWVSGNAQVSGDAWVYGNARVSGDARVYGDARVSGNAWVSGDAWVSGNAQVSGDAWVYGDARVYGDAQIVWFSKVGSENGTLTVTRSKKGLFVSRGCFSGTDVEFLSAVKKKHGFDSKIGREYQLLIEVARSRIDVSEKSNVDANSIIAEAEGVAP